MRAILAISFAVTTALVSTAALAAGDGQGILRRGVRGGQQNFQNFSGPVKPAGQSARFNSFVRPPVQTIAPPVNSGPKAPIQARFNFAPPPKVNTAPAFQAQFAPPPKVNTAPAFQAQFAPPPKVNTAPAFQAQIAAPPQVNPAPIKINFAPQAPVAPKAPAQNLFVQPAPKPVVSAPVTQIKQDLPASRQIVPEASPTQETQQFQATPAPAPKLAAGDVPAVTGTLQAEVPAAGAPAAPPAATPQVAEKPADAQQLIQGDAAPAAAPQADAQAAPQPAPVAPTVSAKPKKIVRYYQQDDYAQDDYGYQPQVRYSYDSGYGGGYNNGYSGGYNNSYGSGYGSGYGDGCQ